MTSGISSSVTSRQVTPFVLVKRGAPFDNSSKLISTLKCHEWVTSTSSTSIEKKEIKKENVYIRRPESPSPLKLDKIEKNKNDKINLNIYKKPLFSNSQQSNKLKKEEIKLFSPKEYFNAQSKRSCQLAGKERTTLQFKLNNKHFNDLLLVEDDSNVQLEILERNGESSRG